MNSWVLLAKAKIPGNGGEMELLQRAGDYSIRLVGVRGELMSSRETRSERALAELGCAHLAAAEAARVLVGGLGMGFTLAAALSVLSAAAQVTVAELVPAVVEWNRGPLGQCAGHPLQDPRSRLYLGDVAGLVSAPEPAFDAILLDVDNGPEGISHTDNQWLYSLDGLAALYNALNPEGALAIWSAGFDPLFNIRLKKSGFTVDLRTVKAPKGRRHTIFIARKPWR